MPLFVCFLYSIRLNFLDHMESWSDQAIDRAKSVVAAKVIFFFKPSVYFVLHQWKHLVLFSDK